VTLAPELIPEPLWGISAAKLLGRKSKAWRDIRSDALRAAQGACASCGTAPPGGRYMVCDEIWSYDEDRRIAELTSVRMLCPACDHARHFARAGQLGLGAEALQTLARVNNISELDARTRQEHALSAWQRRSRLAWDVTVRQPLLDQYPVLAILAGQHGSPGEGRSKVTVADKKSAQ
jgi:hypothetical protein